MIGNVSSRVYIIIFECVNNHGCKNICLGMLMSDNTMFSDNTTSFIKVCNLMHGPGTPFEGAKS